MWKLENWENETWAWADDVFTTEELDSLVKRYMNQKSKKAKVGESLNIIEQRNSNVIWVKPDNEENKTIYLKLAGAIIDINNKFFKYDIHHIEDIQFTIYKDGQYYKQHTDMGYKLGYSRKLSLVLQLTDETNYEGGELLLYPYNYHSPVIANKKRGTITIFPSWMVHEVKPVTKGIRNSLVAWIHGPRFK